MRILANIAVFVFGFVVAMASVSVTRVFGGAWGVVQFPVVALVLIVFFLSNERMTLIAIGIGIGLDLVSSYPFLSWTAIAGGTVLSGWWIAKNILTNRALPSLILLAAAMRLIYFLLELLISRLSQLVGGTVWYRVSHGSFRNMILAFVIEMAILIIFFTIHVRVRGERTRMLTHIA